MTTGLARIVAIVLIGGCRVYGISELLRSTSAPSVFSSAQLFSVPVSA